MNGPFEFVWLDASQIEESAWIEIEGFEFDKRIMHTIGWVLHQDRDYMVVAGTYDEAGGMCCQVLAIPKGCIMKIRDVSTMDRSSDGGVGLGDVPDLDSDDAVGTEKAPEGPNSLVGVPDPGGFGVELDNQSGRLSDSLICPCPCHLQAFGLSVKHVTPCCKNPLTSH